MRVDLLVYANWAGAYTTGGPAHIVLSSTDEDSLADGALETLFHEASHTREMFRPLRSELPAAFEARDTDARFSDAEAFVIPTGATDAMPFLARGYAGLGIGCVDLEIGAPREYHWPTDTVENMDVAQFDVSIDYIETLVRRLWK